MTAREDAIERIERVLSLLPKNSITITIPRLTAERAVAMLKEQEKATVISIHRNGFGSRVGACPNCQSVLHYEYNQSFCGKCGQAVKWE